MYLLTAELEGRPVLVVGGGRIALRKIRGLLDARARVTVVAPHVAEEIAALARDGRLVWKRRKFRDRDFRKVYLAVTATDSAEVNARVSRLGERLRRFVNSVDDPDNCTFFVPARVRRGPLELAISTSGVAPYFAGRLKTFFENLLPEDLGSRVDRMGRLRRSVLEDAPADATERGKLVEDALEAEVARIIEEIAR